MRAWTRLLAWLTRRQPPAKPPPTTGEHRAAQSGLFAIPPKDDR
ncbi:hypothetical protein [Streptomyces tateyamensis]|nr:hypothetical protein [Streptomyces tateyamensis]